MSGEQDPAAWLRQQIEADAGWTAPPPQRLQQALSRGELSINDVRWVPFSSALMAADREAKLAILGELAAAKARRDAERDDYSRWIAGETRGERPRFPGPAPEVIAGLERAVCLLATGYRHREGYAEHWGTTDISNSGSSSY